jgi:hypothetical protein
VNQPTHPLRADSDRMTGRDRGWAGHAAAIQGIRDAAASCGARRPRICSPHETRLRWGERLDFATEARAGDSIYIFYMPPYVPHQEIIPSEDLKLRRVLARSEQQGLMVNLDIAAVESPE